jgi:protein involved in polysaccharide export with SLBB domain
VKTLTCRLLLLLFAYAMPLFGQAAQVFPHAVAAESEAILLGPGDVVRITVWRRPELSGEFIVAADGSLTHPLYRTLRVIGVPLPILETRVQSFLQRFDESPQFVVEPLFRVAVGGEVKRPDLYTLSPETSLAQAIALAGGATERGRQDGVRLLRDGRVTVLDMTRPEAATMRMRIRSGDELTVERRRSVFREYIAPAVTLTGATAAILNVLLRANR